MEFPLLPIIIRWVHIVSACLALGVPLFVRYFLTPAAEKVLDPETHKTLRATINNTWRIMVYLLITLFLLTGLYTFFFVVLPLDLGKDKALYHALFGFKLLLAFVVFFLASALAGRSAALAGIRKKGKTFGTILIFLLLIIIMLAGAMRAIHDQALVDHGFRRPAPAFAQSAPSTLPATLP